MRSAPIPVLYGEGVADRVRSAAGGPVDEVFDVAGKTPIEDLIGLVSEPSRVLTHRQLLGRRRPARRSRAEARTASPSRPSRRSPSCSQQNKLVIKVQTFPFDRAAEAYRISESGHVRGKLVLVP